MSYPIRWIEANGAALRYQLAGDGARTLVLLHEMGGALESWDLVLPTFAAARRVLRYDIRGAGLSEKLRGVADIDVLADDLAALLDTLGITAPVALAGCAVGAAVAIRFAARYPSRVGALIAMAPATGIPVERRAATLALADRLEREGVRATLDEGLLNSYPVELRQDGARFAASRAARLGNDPASYAAIYRMLAGLEMAGDLAAIRCPTLVLAGRLDRVRPPATVELVARAIPGARFQVLETGHFMAVQTPELVAAAMTAFLDEVMA